MSKNEKQLLKVRHSAEHVLTMAIKKLGYKFHMAMGPATDTGFYFDFELLEGEISEKDFEKIEDEMKLIISKNLPITNQSIDINVARKLFKNNPYKQEWLDEIENKNDQATVYWIGNPNEAESFVDLCKGPHVSSTKEIIAIKLLSIAGAYWKGNENNKMLTRIYGTAFETQKDLDEYLRKVELNKQRDHRKLGKELDLFTFSDLVGAGLPLYTPKGTTIKNELQKHLLSISKKYGMQQVSIPHLAKIELYEISGHASKFKNELFMVKSHYNQEFVLKPVNCPHHTQIYDSRPRSYKDLPLRYIESTMQYRDEKPGEIGGLTRTRGFTVDDGHTFCRVDQIKKEALIIGKIIEEFYTGCGMWGKHWVSLSVRDYSSPEKYIGEKSDWDKAEQMIKEVSSELKLDGRIIEGEAAIYGPKIDYMFYDALGNERQLATIQVDFAMPKRFKLKYIDQNGKAQTPVMLHRAILGSYERFLTILIEHFKGAFPTWISPIQVSIIPISENQNGYANKIREILEDNDIRVEIDDRNETMGNKIRKAQEQKIPYMLLIGKKEEEAKTVSLRTRDGQQKNNISLETFTKTVINNIISKSLDLKV